MQLKFVCNLAKDQRAHAERSGFKKIGLPPHERLSDAKQCDTPMFDVFDQLGCFMESVFPQLVMTAVGDGLSINSVKPDFRQRSIDQFGAPAFACLANKNFRSDIVNRIR